MDTANFMSIIFQHYKQLVRLSKEISEEQMEKFGREIISSV
jgi:hypothetical protein